jgi:hypothetical protein
MAWMHSVSGPCRSGRPDFAPGSTTLKTTIDPDDPLKWIFAMLFSVFLRKTHSSSRDVSKALFTPKTTILRVFIGLALRFYNAQWILQMFSEEQKVDRVTLAQDMLQVRQDFGPKQRKYLITGDESWIFWDNHHCGMWAED